MRYLIFIFPLLILLSCRQEGISPFQDNPLNLRSLEAGQKSYFLGYRRSFSPNRPCTLAFTGDTLVLEVSENAGQLSFREFLTPTSPLLATPCLSCFMPLAYPVNSYRSHVEVVNEMSYSYLMGFVSDSLFVRSDDAVELQQINCIAAVTDSSQAEAEFGQLGEFLVDEDMFEGIFVQFNRTSSANSVSQVFYDKNEIHFVAIVDNVDTPVHGWMLLK